MVQEIRFFLISSRRLRDKVLELFCMIQFGDLSEEDKSRKEALYEKLSNLRTIQYVR